ncbi:MAG TPA: hypothetical protein VMZ05_11850 [Spirochaetota bacterium]|nr:hypothetical protein [Spirochaetota bacterium]
MGEYLDQIPERLRSHIQKITGTSGLLEGEESVELIAQAWLEKKKTFEEKIGVLKMEEIETLSRDDTRGAVVMTYSGSLLLIGPLADGARKAQYISIGLRKDVPDIVEKSGAVLAKDVAADETVEFEEGPVKSTSQVFKIAVLSEKLPLLEEEQKISEATQVIAEEFVEVNRTIISE